MPAYKIHFTIVFLLALSLVSCNDTNPEAEVTPTIDSTYGLSPDSNYYSELPSKGTKELSTQEVAIYRTVIDPTIQDTSSNMLLIELKSFIMGVDSTQINFDSIDQVEAFRSYSSINTSDSLLTPYNLGIASEYKYFDSDTFSASLGQNKFWSVFHKKYPRTSSIQSLSRVGFNSDSTTAVLAFGSQCGGLCGQHSVVILKLINAKWAIFKYLRSTIS